VPADAYVWILSDEVDDVINGEFALPSPQLIDTDGDKPAESTNGTVNTVLADVVVILNINGYTASVVPINLLNIPITYFLC
jgi:hypothetical protein